MTTVAKNNSQSDEINQKSYGSYFRWRPTSADELDLAEQKILSFIKRPNKAFYVNIGEGWGLEENKIWTIQMDASDEQNQGVPLVLLHGFASGVALWFLNLDSISESNRRIYAIDVIGFSKSSRPKFDSTDDVEGVFVESIEKWRKEVGLNEKFILLGHSFGGYLSLSYALHHPNNIAHLILADPWGIPSYDAQIQVRSRVVPLWVRVLVTVLFSLFNPLAVLRAAGPWGPSLVARLRPDLKQKYERISGIENAKHIMDYMYHCNAQSNPSGETAFKSLALSSPRWAKNPMINRINNLNNKISLSFIYGSDSWIDSEPGFTIQKLLGDNRVKVDVITDAGHRLYADKANEFNDIVIKTCHLIDNRKLGNNNSNEEGIDEVLAD